jgi:hypothetical protein
LHHELAIVSDSIDFVQKMINNGLTFRDGPQLWHAHDAMLQAEFQAEQN